MGRTNQQSEFTAFTSRVPEEISGDPNVAGTLVANLCSVDSAPNRTIASNRRWLGRREPYFLLAWLTVQAMANFGIYPYLPKNEDPDLNKLDWKLRTVVSDSTTSVESVPTPLTFRPIRPQIT